MFYKLTLRFIICFSSRRYNSAKLFVTTAYLIYFFRFLPFITISLIDIFGNS